MYTKPSFNQLSHNYVTNKYFYSKMARQASPIPTRRNNETKYRRNSFDLPTDECSDDESDNEYVFI